MGNKTPRKHDDLTKITKRQKKEKDGMKLKRSLAGLLCAALLAGLTPLALAAGGPELSLSSGSGTAGGTVTLTLSVKNNPGLAAILVYLYYDTSAFSVDPSEDMKAAGAFQTSGSMVTNTIAQAKENDRYNGDQGKDGVLALWYSDTDLDTDGSMLTLKLHVSDSAAQGSYTVEVGYSQQDTCNAQGKSVSLQTTAGTVTVGGGASDGQETETPTDETPQFPDTADHWAEWYIDQAAQRGLVIGDQGLFRPDDGMSRAEFVTVLWRASGCPKPTGKASFIDLPYDWYQEPIAWAEENGIVNGVGGKRFDPEGEVTREQAATTLHRLAGQPAGMETMLAAVYDSQYPDSGEIGDWAKSALYWAVYNDIYCGESQVDVGSALAPGRAATRAQVAVMMMKYLERF
jgi:predicted RecA/RadA family phage recombinase